MPTVPLLFDRRMVRSRRARSLAHSGRPDFLYALAAAEIADRIATVNRSFATLLVHGAAADMVVERLGTKLRETHRLVGDCLPRHGIDVVFEEELLPLAGERLACFIHAGGLESVNDLPGALIQIRSCLVPDGLFLAAALGGETLKELRAAWIAAESELLSGITPRVAPMVHVQEWGSLLQRAGFALPVVDVTRHVVRYDGALALMRDLKALGLTNTMLGRRRVAVTRSLMARVAHHYALRDSDEDGRIRATFELVFLTGWSPHESQQQPLKPGSARARLADALGVEEKPLKR
jgi:hypothetical protein